MLFDETTLHKLTQLSLIAHQVRAGSLKGERRSTKRGSSIEFADYRNYTPGDDLRRLDWNVFARLEKPFIKMMEEEEDLAVYLLMDTSRSMDWGEGPANKLVYGYHLAAALGAVALGAGDRLSGYFISDGDQLQQIGPLRGSQQVMRLLTFIEGLAAQKPPLAATNLNLALRKFGLNTLRRGLVFIISDLLDPQGLDQGLTFLQSRNFEITLLHVLSPDELEPPLSGDLRLVDIESGQSQEVSIDGGVRQMYRQKVADWSAGIEAGCRKRGIPYLLLNTQAPWDKVVLYDLRRSGIVK